MGAVDLAFSGEIDSRRDSETSAVMVLVVMPTFGIRTGSWP